MKNPKHKYVVHTPECPDDNHCPVCEWGAAICGECGEAEGWLPTECPGEPIPSGVGELIGAKKVDYKDGSWWRRWGGEWVAVNFIDIKHLAGFHG